MELVGATCGPREVLVAQEGPAVLAVLAEQVTQIPMR